MPIVNLTHNADGSVRIRRSITTKVAIGLPPSEGSNYPKRLDHFIFQRKTSKQVPRMLEGANGPVKSGMVSKVEWEVDKEMTEFYGEDCKSFWIVLLDDNPDVAFKTEMAWWTKTTCVCRGDGESATRLVEIRKGETELQDWDRCANHGCPDLDAGRCNPSGDFYFLLADFPTIGSICKLHTGSYQSIREIRSALEDLRSITGGRLMGVKAKLTVRLENSSYRDKSNKLVSGTKHIIGLELTSGDIQQLTDGLASGLAFDRVQARLGARSVEVTEDDDEARADDMAREFYPDTAAQATTLVGTLMPDKAEPVHNPQAPAPAATPAAHKTTPAAHTPAPTVLGVDHKPLPPAAAAPPPQPSPKPSGAPAAAGKPAMADVSDDDLPASMLEDQGPGPAATIGPPPDGRAQMFYLAWSGRKRDPNVVRKYLETVHGVKKSYDILISRFPEALKWASERLPDEEPPEMSDQERKAREAFSALGLNLMQQMDIITRCGNDWVEIYAECDRIADGSPE